jgi:NAD-dependent SIR2 family protein deacetylase
MAAQFLENPLREAASAIREADALLIGAGAGMGVDSGLPDFRGNEGFWNAYPPFRERGLSFVQMANPVWFERDPQQAWGFYGHRRNLYRATSPHAGFEILRRLAARKPSGYFVYTSNVDAHFQRAGFDAERIVECHGSLEHLQCLNFCCGEIWPADDSPVVLDEKSFRAVPPLPMCPRCGELARPNVLMFGDGDWLERRTLEQVRRYEGWLRSLRSAKLAVIECGAGLAVPSVRNECERLGGTLIRINPREPQVPEDGISLPLGALEALQRIDELLAGSAVLA